jgi:hypothetical protein
VQIGIKYDRDIPKKRPIAADSPNEYK